MYSGWFRENKTVNKKIIDISPEEIVYKDSLEKRVKEINKELVRLQNEGREIEAEQRLWWARMRRKYGIQQNQISYKDGAIYDGVFMDEEG